MKLSILSIFYTASLLLLSGCVSSTPKPSDEVKTDATLPAPKLTKNGVIVDMNMVAFEWESLKEDPKIEGVYIYKNLYNESNNSKNVPYYTTITNRFSTHYVDTNIQPDTRYIYKFQTYTKESVSKLSQPVKLNSLPVLSSVTWIYSVTGMPRVAKIIWRPHTDKRVKRYIIERKTLERSEWEEIDSITGRLNAEYIDTELEDNHVYKYRIRVETYDGIVSTPSEIVTVVTKALPNGVKNITATKDLPREIKIQWQKTTQKDFKQYYLYRSESVDGSYTLIAMLYNPVFVDKIDEDGKSYFYRVSVVDQDGLESPHDKVSVHGMTLPKPDKVSLLKAKLNGSQVELEWSAKDSRIKSFTIVKTSKEGWFDAKEQTIKDVKTSSYIDKNIKPGTKYIYKVYGVDENKLLSEPSLEVEIQTPVAPKPLEVQEEVVVNKKQQVLQPVVEEVEEQVTPINDLDTNGL